jgi:hypothetical protein
MGSLYAIQTEDDCRARLGELLEMAQAARVASYDDDKESLIRDLKKRLAEDRKKWDENRASRIEILFYRPAINEAHAHAPSLSRKKTWDRDLDEVAFQLKYYWQQLAGR